jgi:hypothetical protein
MRKQKTGSKVQRPRKIAISNQKGIALVMILILSTIALAIMAGLIYMVTVGTEISGVQKRYQSAREAGKSGAEIAYQVIGARGNPYISSFPITFSDTSLDCLTAKLNTESYPSVTNWTTKCGDYDKATEMEIIPGDSGTYDFIFDLGGSPYPTYRVYTKIINTVEGNSGGDEGLISKGVIASGSGEIMVVSRPYLYTIEVDAENRDNPLERSKWSILYKY